jgi:hypothetical protein
MASFTHAQIVENYDHQSSRGNDAWVADLSKSLHRIWARLPDLFCDSRNEGPTVILRTAILKGACLKRVQQRSSAYLGLRFASPLITDSWQTSRDSRSVPVSEMKEAAN